MQVIATTLITFTILAAPGGERITLGDLAERLARSDVVFLGEQHDNTVGHAAQLEILEELHRRRPDLVLSLEMFERDVQGVLDDYLSGRIDEEAFRAHARPWPNYERHYRPLVEYCRSHGLDVIAANVPRKLARKASLRGLEAVAGERHVARRTTAPDDRYRELFLEAMEEHPGEIPEERLGAFYEAQCLKDDTMAESIADFLEDHPARDPLVVHVCGRFHSDYGFGTVTRLLQRRPLCRVSVVTMVTSEEPESAELGEHGDRGHFVLVVPAEPEKDEEKKKDEAAPAEESPADVVEEVAPAAAAPVSRPARTEPAEEAAPERMQGRPGLGFMPSYLETDEPGVVVDEVSEGGAAEKAGIRAGDRIVAIDEERLVDIYDYMEVLERHLPGDKVTVTIVRGDEEKELGVVLGVRGR